MKRKPGQQGVTLVELLLGLAITGVLMVPLGAMFQNASSSTAAVQNALGLNGELRFAIDRIARRAPAASMLSDASGVVLQPGVAPAPALTYAIRGTDLVETENATTTSLVGAIITTLLPAPPRVSVIASNAVAFKLSAPASASQPLLKIDLTLRTPDGTTVSASRTIRIGSPS